MVPARRVAWIAVALGALVLLVGAGAWTGNGAVASASASRSGAGEVPGVGQSLIVLLDVSPTFPQANQPLTLTATVHGNAPGALTYVWGGLPPGCANSNTAQLVCTPTESGQFQVSVTVTDSQANSGAAMTTVFVGVNPTNIVSGILWLFALIAIAAIVGTILLVYVIVRVIADADRRDRRTPPPAPWPGYAPPGGWPPPPPPPPPPPSPPLR